MSAGIRSSGVTKGPSDRRLLAVGVFAAMLFAAFLVAPGDVARKSYVALHGLCAQRPSHSLQIGGATLPMDARMTGIYLGTAVTVLWLAAARRLQATRTPSPPVVALLASFVVALAVDGFNALLVDLRLPTFYEPSNILRMTTGVLAGTSLGVGLCHLLANSIWVKGDRTRSVLTRPAELLAPVGVSGAIAGLALSNVPLLYAPFAIGLVVAAVGVFWLLGIVMLALLSDRGWSCRIWADLAPLALTSLIVAVATVGALSGLRFAAEQHFGLRSLT